MFVFAVRVILEQMGKTLFFRSGGQPLILNEDQREARVQGRVTNVTIQLLDMHNTVLKNM